MTFPGSLSDLQPYSLFSGDDSLSSDAFTALWLGGVGAVTVVSFGRRLWIAPK